MKTKLKRLYVISAILFLAFLISTLLFQLFEKPFNTQDWKNHPNDRHEMVTDLIESKILLSSTDRDILNVLGEPNRRIDAQTSAFVYNLGKIPSFFESKENQLLIIFQNGEVIKVSLVTK